jgi:hypothetical protein
LVAGVGTPREGKGREGKGLKEERGGVERSCGFVDWGFGVGMHSELKLLVGNG